MAKQINIYRLLGVVLTFGVVSCQVEEIATGPIYDSEQEALVINPTQDEIRFSSEEQFREIRFESNFWWDASIAVEHVEGEFDADCWLAMTPIHNFGSRPVRVSIPRNIEKYDRVAHVTFTSDASSYHRTIRFVQEASTPFIELDRVYKDASIIGDQFLLSLTTTDAWEIAEAPSWIHFSSQQGLKGRDQSLKVTIDPVLIEGSDRESEIVFRCKDDRDLRCIFKIDQAGTFAPAGNLQLVNNEELKLSFDKVKGAVRYDVELFKPNETTPYYVYHYLPPADATDRITIDLSLIKPEELNGYYGASKLCVRSYLSDHLSKQSEYLESINLLFTNGSGSGKSFDSPVELTTMRHFLNVTYAPTYFFRQMFDIDLSGIEMLPFGVRKEGDILPFTGGYDGNNRFISNWKISVNQSSNTTPSLFAYVKGGVLKNIVLKSPQFISNITPDKNLFYSCSYLVAKLSDNGKISNCVVEDGVADFKYGGSNEVLSYYFGSLVGVNYGGVIEGCCSRKGNINLTPGSKNFVTIGGIVGLNGYPKEGGAFNSIVRKCTNEGTSILVTQTNRNSIAGGIAGSNFGRIEGCHNQANIKNASYAGGITGGAKMGVLPIGHSVTWNNAFSISHSSNSGNIQLSVVDSNSAGGGIVGRVECSESSVVRVMECSNHGTIQLVSLTKSTAPYAIAGIAAYVIKSKVIDCYNVGTVEANYGGVIPQSNHILGGVCGYSGSSTVEQCYHAGRIRSDSELVTTVALLNTTEAKYILKSYSLNGRAAIVGDGTPLTEEQMQEKGSFEGWNFETIWAMGNGGYKYPTLQSIPFMTLRLSKKK